MLEYGRKNNAKKKFEKKLYLEIFLNIYIQSIKFSLELMKETRSSKKPLKQIWNNEWWNLDLFYEQLQKFKEEG